MIISYAAATTTTITDPTEEKHYENVRSPLAMSFRWKKSLPISNKKTYFFVVDNYTKGIHIWLKNSPDLLVEEFSIILRCANLKVEV